MIRRFDIIVEIFKKYEKVGRYDGLLLTRRIMLWGFITALPIELIKEGTFSLMPVLQQGKLLFCILYLGILGSGICYVLWNMVFKKLGIVGAVMILVGVFVADQRKTRKIEQYEEMA